MTEPEDDLRWRTLTTEEVTAPAEWDELRQAALTFEPLDHEAGHDATAWLRGRLDEGSVPFETCLALRTDGELLGFYTLEPIVFRLSRRDWIMLTIRRPRAKARSQPASLIPWIARSRDTETGFGHHLFEHAIENARENHDSVALIVEPDGARTRKIWLDYRFMPFVEDETDATPAQALWYPVDQLKAGGWPS